MQIQMSQSLNKLNTLHLESIADYFVVINNINELPEIRTFINTNKIHFLTLGGGSNLILPQRYHGIILHNQLKGIELINQNTTSIEVSAMAGETWDDFVLYTLTHGWFGLENLSLIPGTVGATPIQNIGAYGVEVKDFISYVNVYDILNNKFIKLSNSECNFSYRNSMFKTQLNYIVTSVVFKLLITAKLNINYADLIKSMNAISNPTAIDLRNTIINIRTSKLPNPQLLGNVGSFFHNPILTSDKIAFLREKYPKLPVYTINNTHAKVSAGWLIDNLGLKGYRQGSVGVYDKQALVLVNHDFATQTEVLKLAKYIQEQVVKHYGIDINIEPQIIN